MGLPTCNASGYQTIYKLAYGACCSTSCVLLVQHNGVVNDGQPQISLKTPGFEHVPGASSPHIHAGHTPHALGMVVVETYRMGRQRPSLGSHLPKVSFVPTPPRHHSAPTPHPLHEMEGSIPHYVAGHLGTLARNHGGLVGTCHISGLAPRVLPAHTAVRMGIPALKALTQLP